MCYIQTKASTVKITKITYQDLNAFEFRLLNEIDEIKNVSIWYKDDIIQLRKESARLKEELKVAYAGCHALKNDIDDKQRLIEKHEIDMKKQMEIFKCLNNEVICPDPPSVFIRIKLSRLNLHVTHSIVFQIMIYKVPFYFLIISHNGRLFQFRK